jgi:uncharacterized protein YjiK
MSVSTLTKNSSEPESVVSVSRSAWRALSACGAVAVLLAGCSKSSKPTAPEVITSLPLLETHPLAIREPSDLAIDETGTILWTVTNHPEKVYRLGLDGHLVDSLSYVGSDLEGVAYDPRDKTLWLAEENKRQVVHIDPQTDTVLGKYLTGITGEHNSGLEGICLNDSGTVFVLNEKRPGMFFRLRPDFTAPPGLGLGFALDYSGITYDVPKQCFWIVSDASQRLYRWTASGGVLSQYSLPFAKPEGVAYDPVAKRIYVVSDATNALYVFDSSPAAASAHAP